MVIFPLGWLVIASTVLRSVCACLPLPAEKNVFRPAAPVGWPWSPPWPLGPPLLGSWLVLAWLGWAPWSGSRVGVWLASAFVVLQESMEQCRDQLRTFEAWPVSRLHLLPPPSFPRPHPPWFLWDQVG